MRPRSIAIVGASPREGSFGRGLYGSLRSFGYDGEIHFVNPRHPQIAGQHCHAALDEIGGAVDCVALAVADGALEDALNQAAEAGARGAVLFGRAGGAVADGTPLAERLAGIARSAGMALCGANCMGYVNFADGVQLTGMPFNNLLRRPGPIAIVSHSGSTWAGLIGNQRGLRYNFAVSAGLELVTTVSDYIDYFCQQQETRVVLCVLETVRDPDAFLAAVDNAHQRGVTVIALKLGRSAAGQAFAKSHSGALSGRAEVYEAVFERHGVVSVRTLEEMLDCAELFACGRVPSTLGVGLGSDSGGERQLIADLADDIGVYFPVLQPRTLQELERHLDPGVEAANPLDYWGDRGDTIAPCMQALADDPSVGTVVMATNLPDGRDFLHQCKRAVLCVYAATTKPVAVLGNIASTLSPTLGAQLREAGIAVLMGTETGLRALKHFQECSVFRAMPVAAPRAPAILSKEWLARLGTAAWLNGTLDAKDSFALLGAGQIPVAPWLATDQVDAASAFAARVGYPVVAKIDAPGIAHKSDVGGVALNLCNRADLERAAQGFMARGHGPALLVQKQLRGVELILGMSHDEQFGLVFTLGGGGIFVEIFRDFAILLPGDARSRIAGKIRGLKIFPLLNGARGNPVADIDAVADVVHRFMDLGIACRRQVAEMEINPLMVDGDAIVAVDSLVVLQPGEVS